METAAHATGVPARRNAARHLCVGSTERRAARVCYAAGETKKLETGPCFMVKW